jgi:malonyl CoA-acyl carrier protein transacylase
LTSSIIFPAFVNEYTGTELIAISGFDNNFSHNLELASGILNLDLTGFDFLSNNFLDDELKSQYISYLFSCSVADILNNKSVIPSYVSGYSMGIYAALYYCRVIDLKDGLSLVKSAWEEISRVTQGVKYGMGMIVGLRETEILDLIPEKSEIEICNQNNPHTFIVSGSFIAVNELLSVAKEEGALRTNLLPVSKPYHSKFVKEAVSEFTLRLAEISISAPLYKYVSSMDQQLIEEPDAIVLEIVENLFCRMNWLNTLNLLVKKGTDIFFECGAGSGLTRNNRFIEGDFLSFPVGKLDQFLKAI